MAGPVGRDCVGNVPKYKFLSELDAYLEGIHRKVVFLVDGLETLFRNIMKDGTEKDGIRALCRG